MATQSLSQELEKITAATPFEAYAKLHEFVKELQDSGQATGLQAGMTAKDFALKDALGNDVYLYEEGSPLPPDVPFGMSEILLLQCRVMYLSISHCQTLKPI